MFPIQPITRKLVVFFNGASVLSLLILTPLLARANNGPSGVDVYAGTGTINWSSVHTAGILFAFTKATQGNYYEDANMATNVASGKAAGIYMGVYDLADPAKCTPSTEAGYFWTFAKNYILADGKTLMPVLDFEPQTLGESTYIGASSWSDWINQWCTDVKNSAAANGVAVTPIIYISAGWTTNYLGSANAWTGSWVADYNSESSLTGSPWGGGTYYQAWGAGVWDFWQYTSSGSVSGISGACDEDVFSGSSSQLVSTFLAVTNPIYVAASPTNITALPGSSATFKVTATAFTGSLAYQWLFNHKNISGATTNTYTIPSVQLANAGNYVVQITNSGTGDYFITAPAFLSVLGPLTNAPTSTLDPSNMVNWWTGDGNGYDIYGVTNAGPFGYLSYTNAKVGMGFRFDGSTAFLSNNATEIAPPWTVSVWVYRQNAPGAAASILGDQTYALKLEQYNTTRQVGFSHNTVGDYLFQPAYTVPQNSWTHLAFVATSSSVSIYANGVLKGSTNVSSVELPRSIIGADLFTEIGGDYDDFMLGGLDDLQIYNRELSASEISSIYTAGSAGLVRAPQFTSVTNLNNGQVQLNLIGQTGKAITLSSSTNLLQNNWTSLGSISNPTGATNYTDSTASPQKFYEATQKY